MEKNNVFDLIAEATRPLKPSDFTIHPFSSVLQKTEAEIVARNIMVILKRTGDKFRPLTWEEYEQERNKDTRPSKKEKEYFDMVIDYCKSEDTAILFAPTWKEVQKANSE